MASSVLSALAKRLEGKVALITGGASGIGSCTARIFSQHGAKVVIADIQDDLGHSICKDLGLTIATYVHCDITNEDDVKNVVNTAVTKYGKLDIMYNNAGFLESPKPRIIDNDKATFEKALSINLTGAFLGTKHAAQVMIPARKGSIITTASVGAVMSGIGPHGYTCSKHGVIGLTKNAAAELGQFGIRVNSVSPFAVATPLARKFLNVTAEEVEQGMSLHANLKGVTLKAEDIAYATLFLGSDESGYVSGINLVVDGGYSIVNHSLGMFKYPEET